MCSTSESMADSSILSESKNHKSSVMTLLQVEARFRDRDFAVLDTPAHFLKTLTCPVCRQLLTDPVSTRCGHFFCENCIKDYTSCPVGCSSYFSCTSSASVTVQVINALRVRCPNSDKGCQWQGELGDALDHLGKRCAEEKLCCCPYGCGEKMTRQSEFETHARDHCPNRPFKCQHCGFSGTYQKVTGSHYTTCEMFPLPCPGCCYTGLFVLRKDMKHHLFTVCPIELTACKYAAFGCEEVVNKRLMTIHLATESHSYCQNSKILTTLRNYCLAPSGPKPDLCSLPLSFRPWLQSHPTRYPVPPCVLKLEGFSPRCSYGDDCSTTLGPFYSHYGGYKMCLRVLSGGQSHGEGTHISVYVHLVGGDNDVNLKFPFKATVTVSILNQLEDRNHCSHDVLTPQFNVTEIRPSLWGLSRFVSHRDLAYNFAKNTVYMKDDCLFFRVDKVDLVL